jgi:hypothetical protein
MTYELSDKEREGVYATYDEKRYGYFVNRAADWGEGFTLARGDRWASIEIDGQRYLPVWPHPGFVEEGVSEAWTDYEVQAIEVHKFLDVLENLHEMGDEVALFRQADGDFMTVPPARSSRTSTLGSTRSNSWRRLRTDV